MKWKSGITIFHFVIFAVVVFSVGIFNGISLNYKEKHCTQVVRAEIIRVETHRKTEGKISRTVYTPHFTYSANGKNFTSKAKYTTLNYKYKTGDIIKIRINPENPKKYLVENDILDYRSSYETGMNFGLFALILVACATINKFI